MKKRVQTAKDMLESIDQHQVNTGSKQSLTETAAEFLTDPKSINDASLESFENKVLEGYKRLDKRKYKDACQIWLEGWKEFEFLYKKSQASSLSEFVASLPVSANVNDWLEQLSCELWNLGLDEQKYFYERIAFCTKMLETYLPKEYGEKHDRNSGYWKECLAETLFEIGEKEKTDALFEKWLKEEPAWGYGWIRWARLTVESAESKADVEKSVTIRRRGLAVKNVRNADRLKLELSQVILKLGNYEEAKKLYDELQIEMALQNSLIKQREFGGLATEDPLAIFDKTSPADGAPVGKKEPCPCGSGKKYKRCCGS